MQKAFAKKYIIEKTIAPYKKVLPPFNIQNLGFNKNIFKLQFDRYFTSASLLKPEKVEFANYL